MRYRTLGLTGMEVSAYCLGAMMFGHEGNGDHEECTWMIHRALDEGINFIDTADAYSDGESEVIVGKALRGRRDAVILSTKGYFQMGEGRNRSGSSRRWLVQAVDESLRRLQTDWIDLYQVHRLDERTAIEETLGVLTDLVREGKVRAFGCSSFPAEAVVDAYYTAERLGLTRFRTEQPPYSLLTRGIERAILPTCARLGMGVLTWSPLAWGFLTGKYRKGQPVDLQAGRAALRPASFDPQRPEVAAKLDAVERLIEVAGRLGCTLPQLAIAFPIAHPAVTSVILGPRTRDQLVSALDGSSVVLDDEALDAIDEIVPPGTNVYEPDHAWEPAALSQPSRRRRPLEDRRAA
jgi:aryl-alcohol dehydrogenase-like predicted oxidoreductase